MRISDWSSDVCSSDLPCRAVETAQRPATSGGRAAQDIPRHDAPGLAGKADRAAPDLYPPPRAARSGRGGERDRRRRLRLPARKRSEERRVGKACVRTCKSRVAPNHVKKKTKTT